MTDDPLDADAVGGLLSGWFPDRTFAVGSSEDTLDDAGVDALTRLVLAAALEDAAHVTLPAELISSWHSIDDVLHAHNIRIGQESRR